MGSCVEKSIPGESSSSPPHHVPCCCSLRRHGISGGPILTTMCPNQHICVTGTRRKYPMLLGEHCMKLGHGGIMLSWAAVRIRCQQSKGRRPFQQEKEQQPALHSHHWSPLVNKVCERRMAVGLNSSLGGQ
mmetsp:Transcript_18150/g.34443  ORF Transcript_18150/g.34443 Transcript_18150/m.34443 type:complete len:131 (+) Transcript_18150:386-778(+)